MNYGQKCSRTIMKSYHYIIELSFLSKTSLVDKGWYRLAAILNLAFSTDLKEFKLYTDYSALHGWAQNGISRFGPTTQTTQLK